MKTTRMDIFFDRQDPTNHGWAWSCHAPDGAGDAHIMSGPLSARRNDTSLRTLRRQLAAELGNNFPSAARNDNAWVTTAEGWRWGF